MALISRTLPSLINGVSQQPASLRLDSQCENMVNTVSTVAGGMMKRPPTEHIAQLTDAPLTNAAVHLIDRTLEEKYIILMDGTTVRVFDALTGAEKTVTTPDGVAYLASADPHDDLRMVTVADTTFVINNTVTTSIGGADTDDAPRATFMVRTGNVSQTNTASYTVTLNGTDYTYVAPADTTDTAVIAAALTALIPSGTWTISLSGSVFSLRLNTSADFTMAATDTLGNTGLMGVKGSVPDIQSLPPFALGPITLKIEGTTNESRDDYWMRWEETNTSGSWVEHREPGQINSLVKADMPHVLISNADGTFTFGEVTWNERLRGDPQSMPMPSFAGSTITDVFFFRNRLGFISDENVILSRAGDYFNFFGATATEVLADDPIDLGIAHSKVSILTHAITFNQALLLSSGQTQFMLTSDGPLTPGSAKLDQTTEFEVSPNCRPVGVGPNLYFAVEQGNWTHFREYYVVGETVTNNATNITAHVPQYVPARVYRLAASTALDMLVALTVDAPNEVYVYQYYWQAEEKVQAAWQRWEFPESVHILSVDLSGSSMYLLTSHADGVYLNRMSLDYSEIDAYGFKTLLDRRVDVTGTYDSPTDLTTFTLPFPDSDDKEVIAGAGFSGQGGALLRSTRVDSTTLTVQGDYSGSEVTIGTPYNMTYEFSTQYVKEEQNGILAARTDGRLMMRNMSLQFEDTGYFEAHVTPLARAEHTYQMTGKILGSIELILGSPSLISGTWSFPLYSQNEGLHIELHNPTHLPSKLQSATWEAEFVTRSNKL